MKRSSALAGVVALFLVGVVVGVLGAELVRRHHPWGLVARATRAVRSVTSAWGIGSWRPS